MFINLLLSILTAFSALISSPAKATYFPHDCTMTIGGRCFSRSEANSFVTLRGDTTTSGRCTVLRQPNATAGYSAGSGGFRVDAVRCKAQGTAIKCRIGYIDNDEGFDSGTCTGINYQNSNGATEYGGGSSVTDGTIDGNAGGGNGTSWSEYAYPPNKGFVIPSGKFPVVLSSTNAAIFAEVLGHEQ